MTQSVSTPPLYSRAIRVGDLLYISGQLPLTADGLLYAGHVGQEVSVEQAREAAALAARRCLDIAREELGSLESIRAVARLGGYVSSGEGFCDAPAVVDAASQVVLDHLGGRGRHARLALGVASLPLGACVEIEMAVYC
ncbi:possible endoribonuclease L-PSP (plasmid) [Rhodococcus jostii RHA1]|uniref:Possible endoribonuclease L-PSP n=1 Tax=Rhodococcus jostii (strain RHA1) TaxID=101510 RepID=Q0RXQ3_RHOJR|nr:RidA family protein [Rhodococcus jostii]ABG99933.1 possible endoribonuclease L-PSP [Rhodococcus jostii RHA1]